MQSLIFLKQINPHDLLIFSQNTYSHGSENSSKLIVIMNYIIIMFAEFANPVILLISIQLIKILTFKYLCHIINVTLTDHDDQ